MLELWKKTKEEKDDSLVSNSILLGRLKREKITINSQGLRSALFWNVITFGKCCTYRLYSTDNELIHESLVLGKCYKFPFLKWNDVEIGPCITNAKWRGKGIYPAVLQSIVARELKVGASAFMIIDNNNISSISGVKKAGFYKIHYLEADNLLRIYRPTSKIESGE